MILSKEQIKHMVDRFLVWRLPNPWNPDNGVSYQRPSYAHAPADHDWPSGTNLFDATQAEAMVRYMVEGMPALPEVTRELVSVSSFSMDNPSEEYKLLQNNRVNLLTDPTLSALRVSREHYLYLASLIERQKAELTAPGAKRVARDPATAGMRHDNP